MRFTVAMSLWTEKQPKALTRWGWVKDKDFKYSGVLWFGFGSIFVWLQSPLDKKPNFDVDSTP